MKTILLNAIIALLFINCGQETPRFDWPFVVNSIEPCLSYNDARPNTFQIEDFGATNWILYEE